jgi:methyl-accepting chemotaxis protein
MPIERQPGGLLSEGRRETMKWTIGKKIGAGYALALALLVMIGIVVYSSIERLMTTSEVVAHSYETLSAISELDAGVNTAETFERGYLITGEEKYPALCDEQIKRSRNTLEQLRRLTKESPMQQRRLDATGLSIEQLFSNLTVTIDIMKTQGYEAARERVKAGLVRKSMAEFRKLHDEMLADERELLKMREKEAGTVSRNAEIIIVSGTLISFLILIVVSFVITRSVVKPLAAVVVQLESLSAGGGDLRKRLTTDSSDETGDLARAFNRFMENLSGMIRNLMDYATKLSSSSTEIGAATEEMSRGAESQLNQAVRTSSGMEEMAASIQEVSRNAKNTSETAVISSKMAKEGSQKVKKTVSGITVANDSIRRLNERAEKVGKVVQLIGEIAAQTNILALNAAIEAARAGEHGRGFDVVAEEIRRLAQKTADSTSEIAVVIEEIQNETREAARNMESSTAMANEAGQSLDEIVEGIVSTTDMVQLISSTAAQQAKTSEEIANTLQDIAGVNKQTAQASEEVARAIQDLSLLAERLKGITDNFRV